MVTLIDELLGLNRAEKQAAAAAAEAAKAEAEAKAAKAEAEAEEAKQAKKKAEERAEEEINRLQKEVEMIKTNLKMAAAYGYKERDNLEGIKREYTEFHLDQVDFEEKITTLDEQETLVIKFWLFVATLALNNPYLKTVYIHNMNFDLQFMLPQLHKLFDLKVTIKDHSKKWRVTTETNSYSKYIVHLTKQASHYVI
jgi:hypothetical protein